LENLYGSLSQKAFKGELHLSQITVKNVVEYLSSDNTRTRFKPIENETLSTERFKQSSTESIISYADFYKKYGRLIYRDALEVLKNQADAEDVASEVLPKIYKRLHETKIEYLTAFIRKAARNAAISYKQKRQRESVPLTSLPEDFELIDMIEEEETKKGEILWEKISIEQVSSWIKEKYKDLHFSFEMLLRFLKEEKLTNPYYFSSEELKKYPESNSVDDLHSILFASLNGKNPFLKIKQAFYNSKEENISLNLSEEDYAMISNRTLEDRSGIYFSIIE
jgi:DNA-directed RNA polymerase specialized sigma24 family protein